MRNTPSVTYRDWLTTSCDTRIAVGVVAAVALAVGWLGYGSFGHLLAALSALGLLALPTGVCLLAWLMWRCLPLRSRGRFDRTLAVIGRYSGALALGVLASWPAGFLIGLPLRSSAKTWMLAQTEALDAYFEQHGMYPGKLEDVVDIAEAPRLVRNGFAVYSPSDTSYAFFMGDGPFEDEWFWSSLERESQAR